MPPGKKTPQTSKLQATTGAWQPCTLTWYDPALGGTNSGTGAANPHSPTASGEPYDPNKLTCAAPPQYPFGTNITFRWGMSQVTCRVNDRGGAIQGAHFDLSRSAAQSLGIANAGTVQAQFQVGGKVGESSSPAANPNFSDGGLQVGSILDLITAPIEAIGGWLAGIALNLVKDTIVGVGDVIIVPFWHWNQRAVDRYWQDLVSDKSGKQLLWTGAFWAGGYWLLFTDPNAGNLKPAEVRSSRLAKHTRRLQSVPARQSLVKPKHVKEKTSRKPKPITSSALVRLTDTMATSRTQQVKVTRANAGSPPESAARIESATDRATVATNPTRTKPTVPNSEHRTGTHSLPNSPRTPNRDSGPGGVRGNQS